VNPNFASNLTPARKLFLRGQPGSRSWRPIGRRTPRASGNFGYSTRSGSTPLLLERHRRNHSSERRFGRRLFLPETRLRRVISGSGIDFDKDHGLDIDAGGQPDKIVGEVSRLRAGACFIHG
jgi:hypothetical protein